ncbi:FAD binding domain-containing protein [Oscillibacter sp. MSJ-2]|uniref:FAD binding domain-containing protein n=1 Tax=Dysosmobacter acutus TaxID=2841504 RepID=A0ABS6F5I7_9FIRM|nr:FAD binding domain-containing protein [Dysosmobacter acutus]MBU5625559.1 FAD binding domain-containing protein [Dysosmobacter acutus]
MLSIREYVFAESVEEACALVRKSPANRIIGGGCWLRLERRPYGTLVDISRLGLDQIEEADGFFRIGGCCTLRQLERSALLRSRFGSLFAECTAGIVGVQFRNCATLGGSLYGRFGFSDLATALLALEAEVDLCQAGRLSLEDFLKTFRHGERDVLTAVRIPADARASFASFRLTATDLPVLNAAVGRRLGRWRIAVGARPAVAALAPKAAEQLAAGTPLAAETAARELRFGSNLRGSAQYRAALCQVLVERCIQAQKEEMSCGS